MTEPQGLTVLINKYAELASRLEALDRETRAVRAGMAHLDASIQLIRHGYDVRSIRPKNPYCYNPYVKRGTYARVAMNVLRDAGGALPAREICHIALQKHGAVNPDEKIVTRMVRAMETCLMKKVKEGKLIVDKNHHPKQFSYNKNDPTGVTRSLS
jgi:hypothetical protein